MIWRILAIVLLWTALAEADTATITYVDNSNNEDGFEIQRNLNGGAWANLPGSPTGPNITSVTDTTLVQTTSDNTYCYRVRAVNKGGASAWATGSGSPVVPACKTIAAIIMAPAAPSETKVNGGAAARAPAKSTPTKAKK